MSNYTTWKKQIPREDDYMEHEDYHWREKDDDNHEDDDGSADMKGYEPFLQV